MSAQEITEIEADLAYWKELADAVGWRVLGWTYRRSVTYITKSQWSENHEDTIVMTGVQRDSIINAFKAIKTHHYHAGYNDGEHDAQSATNSHPRKD